ncbi:glycoside hydrolase family 68 protein [Gluconobacter wancherniae]|uniref:Levansucrase n=1 Tax=Gluconobacter wancherniae NBRC 103581 TaxID=656744 RepID=A0A511B2I5_9PROT|nr:glycoside hydrolase family 68 protein [Gluconobacter wancherniae]MBF0854303.1 glycoside hydrolase family 68 protein [Gluconobacter wancherniae]GBD57361.1 levansucrase [Gluconobacter wancherniae NBRC 103581]GBR62525.1 levansucrase [Gluconobacter wancherniae NBRC 103581]GEK93863.1 levansucrase [Gluconobacter wancherniae NBRC 103581]
MTAISSINKSALLSQRKTGTRWTIADALKIHADDPTTTMPLIDYDFPVIDSDVWQWDTWALRDINGRTVTFKGWYVMFALVADRAATGNTVEGWHSRNNFSYIGFYYSRTGNGSDWKFGGRVIQPGANKRDWEWSGCAVMRENTTNVIDLFYTSVNGTPAQSVPSHTAGRILADDNGVWFEGFDVCTDMFEADGVNYANIAEDQYWDFRDPHVFVNPDDGNIYALFEGNVPGMRGQYTIDSDEMGNLPPASTVPAGAQYGAAAIGIARLVSDANSGDFSRWEMLPALVTALGVNDQTERPHVVFQDGLTYLFTISHHSTFTGNSTGPDGVYGFVSRNGIFGPYAPLNGSGLVLGNPSDAPYETYSHFVDPAGYVQSFIDTLPQPGTVDPGNPQTYRIGGTLAPTVRIVMEGERTFLTEVHAFGSIFAQVAWPVSSAFDTRS